MADPTRIVPQTGTGVNFAGKLQDEVKGLWDRGVCTLTSIGGTGDAITAILVPALTAGMIDGMAFWLTPGATNTGAVTVAINGAAAIPVVDIDGNPLDAGEFVAGRRYLIVADGGELRIAAQGAVATGGYSVKSYLASATWTKPDGLVKVRVRVRGGGGGGGSKTASSAGGGTNFAIGSGGGGGGEAIVEVLASSLASTVAVTVGAGGAAGGTSSGNTGGTGGTSSFGTHAVATGGTGGVGWEGVVELGGNGGIGTAGNILLRGQNGEQCELASTTLTTQKSRGGASPTGGFSAQPTSNNTAINGGANTGVGGSGGRNDGTNVRLGGVGGSGWVIIEEFF